MKSLAPNTLIQNRYLIVQLIGKGGMGEVYLAVDQRLGSAIALKRMLFSDEEALGHAFEREAKTLARLRHPALTKVSDHFTENGNQYLVMEHISGDDLSKRLEQNGKPFPLSWVLFWADQLLDALHYLHSHEPPIIHRDIKPQNLKLTADNHIILLDFGLAKDSIGETRLSSTGNMIAYTPNYASMEQIRGTGTTGRSDIYALSATMYQLLSNTVPPDALTRADNVLNNQPDPVTPLNELNPEVFPAISNIIIKGMSLSAEQRYANAKEMQMALREAYTQVQQGMSAETMAFKTAEQNATPTLQSDIKTAQFSAPNVSIPVDEKIDIFPIAVTAENAITVTESPANFDVTIPYGTPFTEEVETSGEKTEIIPVEVSEPSGYETLVSPIDYSFPVGEKTEVIPTNDSAPFGEKTEVLPMENSFPVGEKTEVLPMEGFVPIGEQTDFFSAEATAPNLPVFEDIPPSQGESYQTADLQESYAPEMTVPLVNYGEQISELPSNETSNFVSSPINETSNFVSVPQNEVEEKPVVAEVKEVPKVNTAKAGGGSKVLMIVGILAVLGFLGIGAAGAGAYFFMPELFGVVTPTPTPGPTVEPTPPPTVSPVPESTLQADTNTDKGNSSVDLTNTDTNNGTVETNTKVDKPEVASDKTPHSSVDKPSQPTQQQTKPTTQQTKPTTQQTKPTTQQTKPTTQQTKPATPKPTVDHGKIQ